MKVVAALILLGALGASGCAGRECTLVGGSNGVAVEIPRSLFVHRGRVDLEVCDTQGCASAHRRLDPVPGGPVGRVANVTFEDLGRRFEPGSVTLAVRLSRPDGEVIARTRREVELTRSYPNGKACDGEGYVHGSMRWSLGDRG